MAEGISTLIRDASVLDERMGLVTRDARVMIQHTPILVTVATFTPRGTHQQNALFHALCDHIATWWNGRFPGNLTTPERVKTSLKVEYGVKQVEYCPLTGTNKPRLASWTEYNRAQRAALITATLAWMAENGIPDLPEIPAAEYARYREAQG